MRFLRQNTATRVTVGPFLDKTDGITPETALTVTNEKLTFVVENSGVPTLVIDTAPTASGGDNDMAHITNDDAGFYDLELTAAQTNYVGRAILSLTDAANHCPVFHEFTILPANVYDSMFGSDLLQVDMTQIAGAAVDASSAQIGANVVNWKGSAAPANTGDAYARLGAPAGASVSADIASVKNDSSTIKSKTDTLSFTGSDVKATLDGEAVILASGTHTGAVIPTVTAVSNDVGITQAAADKVWNSAARTLTSFGTLITDIATAVWGATTRTLTAFGFNVTASSVTDKTGYSLATAPPTAAEVRAEMDSNSTKLAKLDAAVSTRATPADIPTAIQNADALLKRDMSAVTDEADRSPLNALRAIRNKTSMAAGMLTVTKEDDATAAWTAALTTDADAEPITGVDPS